MKKRAKALLIPAILLAILLAGCRQDFPEVLVVPPPKQIVTTSTVFPLPTMKSGADQNSMTDYQRWLQDNFNEARERAGQ